MTAEQLYYINSVSRGIDDIERLLDNPGHLRFVKNNDRGLYYNVNGYFSINNDVSNRINKIIEDAENEIKTILNQEIVKLKSEFSKIVVQTPKTSDNENN